jgi:cytochrome c5
MSDPAIVAASRACEGTGLKPRLPSASEVSAAREALRPIRELHYPVTYATASGALHMKKVCAHCHRRGLFTLQPEFGDWPCETARLVYPESELS